MAFRVLSINGGGMRGIYAAAYLEALETTFLNRLKRESLDIGKGFNLIAGTSTGAIIGCGLAKGVSPSAMVKFYQDNGKKIFPLKLPKVEGTKDWRGLWEIKKQLTSRPEALKSGETALREALTSAFGDMTFKQVWDDRKIALAVTAVKMSNYKPRVFKTPHNVDTNHCDDSLTLVNACLASSAAPIYRSLAAIDHETDGSYDVFTDGGLWANNPIIVALTESLRILTDLGDKDESVEIYCLGSCAKPSGIVIEKNNLARGLQHWEFGGDVAQVSITAQEFAFDFIADELIKHLDRDIKIIKFPSGEVNNDLMQYLGIDETRPSGLNSLITKAKNDAMETNKFVRDSQVYGPLITELFNVMPLRSPAKEEGGCNA